jgi:tetratricopeptide (TPR) repeat protein
MKKVLRAAMLSLLVCVLAPAQKLFVESDTQEGQLLQQIDAEENAAKKLALLETFAKRYPNHEAITWVFGQLQTSYLAQKEYDKVLAAATKILSLDPDDVSAAFNGLKATEAKEDVDLMRKWADLTAQIAKKAKQSKAPEDPDEVADWKQKVSFAKEVEQYTEYAIYHAAILANDLKLKAKLMENLEQKNPTSEYLAQLRTSQTAVVRQVDVEEAVAAAELDFRKGLYNEEALMMAATYLMQRRREPEKVITYSSKVVEVLNSKPKPPEISDAEWDRKKRNTLATAYWMMGLLYSTSERYQSADRALRSALPLLKNSDMLAGALYHLGYVNYRLAEAGERIRIHEAVKYTSECMAISSAVQQQCTDNLKSMKAEYNLP